MDSKFKILFYIAIGVVYFISKVYASEKKKQNRKSFEKKPINTSKSSEIFEELKRQLNIPTEQQNKQINTQVTSKWEKTVKEKMVLEREIKPRKRLAPMVSNIKDEVVKPEVQQSELMQDFDPRKAIIFGEILKRPQY